MSLKKKNKPAAPKAVPSPVSVTTVYLNSRYTPENSVVNELFDSPIHCDVAQLLRPLEAFIVHCHEIVNVHENTLIEHLKNGDYEKFYRLVAKIATDAAESLK